MKPAGVTRKRKSNLVHLIVDIGNSKVKTAIYDEGTIVRHAQWGSLGAEKLEQWLDTFTIEAAIYSDVRGSSQELTYFLQSRFSALALTHDTPLPITLAYRSPKTLGKDRIAGAVGGASLYPDEPVLVIDLGTSITYDMVEPGGRFVGGQISPGLHMRFKALHTFTGKLPLVGYENPVPEIGYDTATSMRSGIVWGLAHEVNGFIHQYQNTYPGLKVILTGGDAPVLVSRVKYQIFAVPQLILSGLNKILQYNVELDK